MNELDKAKLRVLIKVRLLEKSPNYLSSKQLESFINHYNWGFSTDMSTSKIAKFISMEMKRTDNHFLDEIECRKRKGYNVYRYPSRNVK